MTFFNPWAFGFLGIIPAIVLLYLLKLKRTPLPVSTLMFWQRVLQENQRRALFQRLRQWLSLLFHLLIFTLILLALARPSLDRSIREGASTVIVLDDRARMQAIEPDGKSRFEKALRLADAMARQAGPVRQIAILCVAGTASVRAPFTGDEKELRAALHATHATDAGGDLPAATRLAQDLLRSRSGLKRIVVFTDRPVDLPLESGAKAEVTAVGSALENVAVTRFTTRPLPASPETSEVLLQVHNFGQKDVSGNAEISLDGRILDVKPFHLGPGQEHTEIFSLAPPAQPKGTSETGRGWLTAKLDVHDALAADNLAYAFIPPHSTRRVMLITKGNWFLEKLLESEPGLQFELLGPDSFQPELIRQFDVTILDNYLPAGLDLAHVDGSVLFLGKTPFTATAAPAVDHPLVTDLDVSHPMLRLVDLEHVSLLRASVAEIPAHPPEGWLFEAPVRSFDHPLLITGKRRTDSGEIRLAAFTFDIADSDLPLRVAFPLLMSNAIHWLAGDRAASAISVKAGQPFPLSGDESVETKPGATDPQTRQAAHVFAPLMNGFYEVHSPAQSRSSWAAVNTFDEAESNLNTAASPAKSVTASAAVPSMVTAGFDWPLWQYLTLTAIALFTLEWWLFHRRRTE